MYWYSVHTVYNTGFECQEGLRTRDKLNSSIGKSIPQNALKCLYSLSKTEQGISQDTYALSERA